MVIDDDVTPLAPEVPLAVEEDTTVDIIEETGAEIIDIEDEETPMASGIKKWNFPWWIVAVVGAVFGGVAAKTGYDRKHKKNK